MLRMTRTPLLLSATLVLAAAGALPAQQREIVSRRTPRADGDTTERQLRRLERSADSLERLFNDEDRSLAERRSIGESLDRTVRQIEALARRTAEAGGASVGRVELRGMFTPAPDDRAARMMGRAFVQAAPFRGAMPRGWVGIVISGAALEPRIENDELFVRYLNHPEIVSVEPSSPAERAGIAAGDTLMAYNGRDVRGAEISITRLLRPNARVVVRVRRNGRTRDFPVMIADVPSRISLRTEMNNEMKAPRAETFGDPAPFPRAPSPPVAFGPPPTPAIAPVAPMAPMAPTPGIIYSYGYSSVAGAQLAVITEGLAKLTGVRQGVLITQCPPGSLAYQSDLRDGDVIVSVEGTPVRTVSEVRSLVQTAFENGGRAVSVGYLREKRARKAVLRWSGAR